MQYEAPYGVTDTNAPYINGNPAAGIQGSIPPAAAFEYHQRELVALIMGSGLGPTDTDLQQVLKSVRTQFINYGNDVGVANQLGCGFIPPLDSYSLGMPFRIRVAQTNTGASTFDGGCGPHPIKHIDGSDPGPGDLPAGGMIEMLWDGTNFQLTNYMGRVSGGNIANYYIKIPYAVDTSTIANSIIAPFTPAITTVNAGDLIEVMVMNTVTGASTIYVSALPPVAVTNRWGGPLRPFDIVKGEIVMFVYTGSAWQMIGYKPQPMVYLWSVNGQYTWTCPPGCWQADVQVWGAGSSGYNSYMGPTSYSPGGTDGNGGNSGGYVRSFALPVTPGTVYNITVGKGGASCYGQGSYPGGSSSFGTKLLTATGGAITGSWNGAGVGSGGDINLNGNIGSITQVNTGVLGYNGAYGFGAGAPFGGGSNSGPSLQGSWPGGGGGGGAFYGPSTTYPSGPGADGGVLVKIGSL